MEIKTRLQMEKRKPSVVALPKSPAERESIDKTLEAVAARAFALFCERGRRDGHDLDDWLAAEREFFRPAPCEVGEKGNELMLRIEVPGFNERELRVNVDADRLYVMGHKEKVVRSEAPGILRDERDDRDVFRALPLPAPVVPEKATANLHEGILTVFIPKANANAEAERSRPAVA